MADRSASDRIGLAEVKKAYSKNDDFLRVINALVEMNHMLDDAPYVEATAITENEIARVLALPVPSWVKIGEGWTATHGTLQNDIEGIGILKSRAQINKDVAKKQANPARYMTMQEALHLEAQAQEIANTLAYGESGTTPEEFDGLDIRFASLSHATDWPTGGVFNNGESSGSVTSLWLIQWHETDCCLIYPRFSTNAGLTREEKPDQLLPTEAESSPYSNVKKAWFAITEFEWQTGFSLADNRRVKRVCNINPVGSDAQSLDIDVVNDAIADFETEGMIIGYANKQIFAQIQRVANNKGNVHYPPNQPFAEPMPYIGTTPIRRMKAITNSESVLTT